ncbi:MAG: hypothetical protein KDK51_11380 [Deltaproteobacteria bacterium]|nr:hypothetical protein [Deltaproteobacteria bacterium]
MNLTKWLIGSSMVILISACDGVTGIQQALDGDAATTQIGFQVSQPSSATTALTQAIVSAEDLSLDVAKACIEKIKLKLPDHLSCADVGFVEQSNVRCETETEIEDGVEQQSSEIKISGPFDFDLLTGQSTPSLADIMIPSGSYREIEFDFHGDCGYGEEISLVLEGTATDVDSTPHPFAMYLEYDDDLEIESLTDINVLEDQANQIFATLDLNNWFAEIDWVQCIADGDLVANPSGTVVIDQDISGDGVCNDVYEDILDGIKMALEFEDDDDSSNDDGQTDDSSSDDDDDESSS